LIVGIFGRDGGTVNLPHVPLRTSRTIEEAVADLTDNLSQQDTQYTVKNIVRAYFNEYIDILG
jgi:hypothetical protein